MKTRFILFRRAGVYYSEDASTRQQHSLRTKDEAEALTLLRLVNADASRILTSRCVHGISAQGAIHRQNIREIRAICNSVQFSEGRRNHGFSRMARMDPGTTKCFRIPLLYVIP